MPFSALVDAFAKEANIANLALLVALAAVLWENVLLHRQLARTGDQLAEANRRFDGFIAELHLFNARLDDTPAPRPHAHEPQEI